MKLTKAQKQKARTLAAINGQPLRDCVRLVTRRAARLNNRPTMIGSVKKAESYFIL